MKKVCFAVLAVLTLACASCRQGKLSAVSGRVTHGGEPAAGAVVYLRRIGADPMNEPTIMGIVQEDGSFTVVTGDLGQGVPPGEYDVLIEWKQVSKEGRGLARRGADRLNGRYAHPAQPRLHVVIGSQTNQLPPFELLDE